MESTGSFKKSRIAKQKQLKNGFQILLGLKISKEIVVKP